MKTAQPCPSSVLEIASGYFNIIKEVRGSPYDFQNLLCEVNNIECFPDATPDSELSSKSALL
jgi:hypothetical protein